MKKLFFILFGFVFSFHAQALMIVKMKDSKVLIQLEGAKVIAGQSYEILNAQNKNIGTLKILSLKETQAIGQMIKGAPRLNEKIFFALSSIAPVPAKISASAKAPAEPVTPRLPYRASVLLGLATNTLSIRVADGINSQTVDNTGNSVSFAVAVDHQFKPWLNTRALFGYDQFNAVGAATINGCANKTSKDCKTDIKYVTAASYLKYEKEYSSLRPWGIAGLNIKMPISKSSNALDESSLGLTLAYAVGIGADYVLETKNFVSFCLEKQFFIKSDSAETSTLMVRLGAGKEF